MSDQQQLRVGVVAGCGTHGTNLALAVARSNLLQLVAVLIRMSLLRSGLREASSGVGVPYVS